MFNRKTQNVEKIRNLKHLISKKYKLSENTLISIAELSCHEPIVHQLKLLLPQEMKTDQ